MGFLAWLMKNGIGVALGVFALPVLARWAWHEITAAPWPPFAWWALLAGAGLAFLMHLWRKPTYFLHTYLHENAHAAMCLVLRVPIKGFSATDGEGGAGVHTKVDPFRTVLILIAPYVAPFYLAPALGLRQILPMIWPETGQGWPLIGLQFVVGLAIGWQVWDLWRNVRYNFIGRDSDLQRIGQILAVILMSLAWILIAVWTVWAVSSGHRPA